MSGPGTLSEAASKALLQTYGVPIADEREVADAAAAVQAADGARLSGRRQVVWCRDRSQDRARSCAAAARRCRRRCVLPLPNCWPRRLPADGDVSLLVAPMIAGSRELIAGVVRDPQFGANVMLGVGGIIAEAIADVQFRPAPISEIDAHEMIDGLATQKLLGAFRGEPAVDREQLTAVLMGLSALATSRARCRLGRRQPVDRASRWRAGRSRCTRRARRRPSRADAATHVAADRRTVPGAVRPAEVCSSPVPAPIPASSASSACTTSSPAATRAQVFGTNLEGEEVLGIRTVADIADLPDDAIDLVFVCTPGCRQRKRAARLRGQGRQGRVPDQRRLRRGRRSRARRRGRAGRARRRARHPAGRSERPGCRQHSGQPVRPDRRSVSAERVASRSPARAATSSAAS